MHGMSDTMVIAVLTEQDLVTARRITSCLTGALIHGYTPRVSEPDVQFDAWNV